MIQILQMDSICGLKDDMNTNEKMFMKGNEKYSLQKDAETNLFQIIALIDIPKFFVKAGDRGGFVQVFSNLSCVGRCWIKDKAMVIESAYVSTEALIMDNAIIKGRAHILDHAIIGGNQIIAGDRMVGGASMLTDDESSSYTEENPFTELSEAEEYKNHIFSNASNLFIKFEYDTIATERYKDSVFCGYAIPEGMVYNWAVDIRANYDGCIWIISDNKNYDVPCWHTPGIYFVPNSGKLSNPRYFYRYIQGPEGLVRDKSNNYRPPCFSETTIEGIKRLTSEQMSRISRYYEQFNRFATQFNPI